MAATRIERALQRAARERRPDDLVLARGKQQRERRSSLAEVGAGDLPGLDRVARAVEDVVGDLEGDPELEPEAAERAAGAERAGCLEELPGLESAALEVRVDSGVGAVTLAAAASLRLEPSAEARLREGRDRREVTLGRELGEPRAKR